VTRDEIKQEESLIIIIIIVEMPAGKRVSHPKDTFPHPRIRA
jgi:hypothetical protein